MVSFIARMHLIFQMKFKSRLSESNRTVVRSNSVDIGTTPERITKTEDDEYKDVDDYYWSDVE